MSEIQQIPWNGFKVASTFSGTGGSCLGYRMAGFRVVWANEFIANAQQCYKLNHPDSILDTRDIRTVQADEILSATGLKRGELDLFDGSPPCDSFSTAGKRDKGWGKSKAYMGGERHQRTDDLTWEWLRILEGLQPKTFVMENVSGLVKGRAKGMFKLILKDARAAGYRVKCRVLDAQWLGVPQARQRTIFVGVRKDLKTEPVHPSPLPYRYSVRDALPDAVETIEGVGPNIKPNKPGNSFPRNRKRTSAEPCGTITAGAGQINGAPSQIVTGSHDKQEQRKLTIPELRRICSFPDDFQFVGPYAKQWERMGMSVPPVMMSHVASAVRDKVLRKE